MSWYLADSGSVTVGTQVNTYVNTWAEDGSIHGAIEINANPGLVMVYTFTNIPVISKLAIKFHAYYDGNPAHTVKLQIMNWNTTWEDVTAELTDFPSESSLQDYRFFVPDLTNYISGTNEISLRIDHNVQGTPGHTMDIDYMWLDENATSTTTTSTSTSTTSTTSTLPPEEWFHVEVYDDETEIVLM